jgi:hypothetical protein
MGLYVDEHRDFREEIDQARQARGKGSQLKKFEDLKLAKQGKLKKWRGEGTTWERGIE